MRSDKFTLKTFLYLLPAILIFAVFVFWPIIYTIYLSFFDWNMISPVKRFVGFENYIDVLSEPDTYQVLGNTLFYIVILVIFNFVFPYIFAYVLHFLIPKFKDFFNLKAVSDVIYIFTMQLIPSPSPNNLLLQRYHLVQV